MFIDIPGANEATDTDLKVIERLCKDFKIYTGEAEALALALKGKLPQLQENLSSMDGCFL